MKKILVATLLTSAFVINCVAFAADSIVYSSKNENKKTDKQTTVSETAKSEKPMVEPEKKPEKPMVEPEKKPEKPMVEPEKKPEKPMVEPEKKPEKPMVEPEKKPEKPMVEPEKKPEKKVIDKNKFEEEKEKLKKEKPNEKEYMSGVKGMFKDADEETREEILDEIAALKKKGKDTSVDTFIDGDAVEFDKYGGVKPIIENGSALVPVRALTETYNADVKWDKTTQTITITKNETIIVLRIGSIVATVNDEEKELAVAPIIHNERTIVPIRFIAEAFGLDVDWDNDSRTIIVE